MGKRSHGDLQVWRKASDLARTVYALTRGFPPDERYGLTAQMRRAAVSVPANIAEGSGRWGPAELQRYLSIARGSLAELETLVELARGFDYLREQEARQLHKDMDEVAAMLVARPRRRGQAGKRPADPR